MTTVALPKNASAPKIIKRYNDAYRHARFVIFVGTCVKILGFFAGIAVAIAGWITAQNVFPGRHEQLEHDSVAGGSILGGVMLFASIYIVGLLIRAAGQMLLAALDSAVHSSPFLSNDEKAESMRL